MIIEPSKKEQLQARAILELRKRHNQIGNRFEKYIDNPIGFIEIELDVTLTEQQKEIVLSVWYNFETNVQAAHGQGKTFIAALIVLTWLYVMRGMVITTAPTARQVKLLLWKEIRRNWPRGKFGGRAPDTTQLIVSDDVSAYGYTADDTDENAFQGVHHPKLLAIQDEASGVSDAIDEGFQSCCSGVDNRMLRIGNPTDPQSPFKRSCDSNGAIKIPAWTHPNTSWAYDGENLKPEVAKAIMKNGEILDRTEWPDWCQIDDPISGAVSVEWIEKARQKYGTSSRYWKSRVCGEWPDDAIDSLLPSTWFQAAIDRYLENPDHWDDLASEYKTRHGLDVADGNDDHATATWQGPLLIGCNDYQTKGDMLDVSRAASIGIELASDGGPIVVDNTGVGAGALSEMVKVGSISAYGMKYAERAEKSDLYFNIKAQAYWEMREGFRVGKIAVKPFTGWQELQLELAAIGYVDDGDRIRIEKKDKTRKKLGKSPDKADACMMAFFAPSRKRETFTYTPTGGRYSNMSI